MRMTIKIGDHLPDATFRLITSDGPRPVTTSEFFKGRKVVLFGLPGAFTPTCHKNHLPGFLANEAAIKARGVEVIAMTSVNDPHVAKATGLEFDASAGGMGLRSKRYSMLVEDGVVKSLNIEDSPGKADVSGADRLLAQL
jgi:peroxiredoxin